jgi:hypothetical protein
MTITRDYKEDDDLPENLVLSGGGVNIVGHVGAVNRLRAMGKLKKLKNVAGTSAGAFIALTLALKLTEQEMYDIAMKIDFKKFLHPYNPVGLSLSGIRFLKDSGFFSTDYLRNFIDEMIEKKLGKKNATFADLKKFNPDLDLHAVVSNISRRGKVEACSFASTPNECVADAVTASMAVPILFNPVPLHKDPKSGTVEYCVDGGTVDNLRLRLFDEVVIDPESNTKRIIYNPKTLGLLLAEPDEAAWTAENKEPAPDTFSGVFGLIRYVSQILKTAIFRQKHEMLRNTEDVKRVAFIPVEEDPLNFWVKDASKLRTHSAGDKAVVDFYKPKKIAALKQKETAQPLRSKL